MAKQKREAREGVFHKQFLEDLRFWIRHDRKIASRCLKIVEATLRDPFTGMGNPKRLMYLGGDVWSRRLTQERRVVYLVRDGRVDFLQARYHY